MTDVAVLIVGAGPTGLMAAVELARRGVPVRLIEQAEEPTSMSRAIGVQARTLEIFEKLGIVDDLLAAGQRLVGACMYASGRLLARATFDELDTRYPFILSIPQAETERILTACAGRHGVSVEHGVVFEGFDTEGEHLVVSLRRRGAPEKMRARWLIGADGAHSAVRHAAGLSFPGESVAETFWLADVTMDGQLPRDSIHTFFAPDGVLACFPLPGDRWRMVANAPHAQEGPSLEECQALVAERSHISCRVAEAFWLGHFRIHTRQVETYRVGPVFLAGDAAHVHSPVGGQGLNTGIQDAHNLAWKLALVHENKGRSALLDSYHAERHAVGRSLLGATDFATRVGMMRHPIARAVRNRVAQFLANLEVVQERIVRKVAELDLDYARSPIVSEHASPAIQTAVGARASLGDWNRFRLAPRAGIRAPDGFAFDARGRAPARLYEVLDGRWSTLLVFAGLDLHAERLAELGTMARSFRDAYGEIMRIVFVLPHEEVDRLDWDGALLLDTDGDLEDRYGARAECMYLVRPDFYIGFRSQPVDVEAFRTHLATWIA